MAASPRPASSGPEPESVKPLKFVYDLPPISERQLAIVKLVARYAVCDGQFAATRAREFDFTSAGHELNPLYKSFEDQYRLVLSGFEPERTPVLQRAVRRALLEPEESPQSSSAAQAARSAHDVRNSAAAAADAGSKARDDERQPTASAYAAIDWQDFVVLETVEFFSADLKGTSRLSAPLTREEAALHRAEASRKRKPREPLYKSPYTGESIPASQFEEHMRVHSLDPSWQKQKQVAAERQATTNLDVKGAAANLARLQEKRRRLLEE